MKQFRSTLILLAAAVVLGGYLYWRERGPAAQTGNTVLLRTDPAKISQIQIQQPDSQISLVKSGENWQVKNDKTAVPADPDTVQTLLDQLQLVQSAAIVTQPGKLGEYGLENGKNVLTVQNTRLIFGDSPEFDSSKLYVQVKTGNQSTIALLPVTLRDDALKSFADWRDKAALRFDEDKVTQVKIEAPHLNATFAAQKKQDTTTWKITAPLAAAANSTTVQSFLSSVKNAKITDFLDDQAKDLSKWKLDKPQATVQLITSEGVKTLKIGRESNGGYAAQNSLSGSVFVLPADIFSQADRPLKEWRDKDVVALDTAQVNGIRVTARGKSIALKLSGTDWKASGSKLEQVALNNSASDILVGLQNLQADDFIDSPQTDAIYGFDKPALEISLTSSQWKGTKTVQLATAKGKNYARSQGADVANKTVYLMPDSVFDAFSGALDRLFGKAK